MTPVIIGVYCFFNFPFIDKIGLILANKYIQIEFSDISNEQVEMLVAELNEIGFEGYEEIDSILKAFIPFGSYDENALKEIADKHSIGFKIIIIEETNWNEVWESNFQPVIIENFVAIRAGFHQHREGVEHEIVITPKMSFGTGHHATTYMMIQQMREIGFANKSVFDFGTGTGVLAILAEKLGASKVIAIDNDQWSINNAAENFEQNKCGKIQLIKTGIADVNEQFDVILANINKNTIIENFPTLCKQLVSGGIILISGLIIEDEKEIIQVAGHQNVKILKKLSQLNWLSIAFTH